MRQKLVLSTALSVILVTTLLVNANDSCALKQGIAFVANQPLGAVGFGHVAVGFQTCDGRFFFESLGPGNYVFPTTVKAEIENRNFANWAEAEKWISEVNPRYSKIKIIKIDDPDPNAALTEMGKPENYNLLASTAWNQETEDNCLTYTIKVLTAYGVKGLRTSPPTEAPNTYFEAYIPGKEYSWNSDLNRYSDSEGNAINVDSLASEGPNAAVIGATTTQGSASSVVGKWTLNWLDGNIGQLDLHTDGTFTQTSEPYRLSTDEPLDSKLATDVETGKWEQNGNVISLQYETQTVYERGNPVSNVKRIVIDWAAEGIIDGNTMRGTGAVRTEYYVMDAYSAWIGPSVWSESYDWSAYVIG